MTAFSFAAHRFSEYALVLAGRHLETSSMAKVGFPVADGSAHVQAFVGVGNDFCFSFRRWEQVSERGARRCHGHRVTTMAKGGAPSRGWVDARPSLRGCGERLLLLAPTLVAGIGAQNPKPPVPAAAAPAATRASRYEEFVARACRCGAPSRPRVPLWNQKPPVPAAVEPAVTRAGRYGACVSCAGRLWGQ